MLAPLVNQTNLRIPEGHFALVTQPRFPLPSPVPRPQDPLDGLVVVLALRQGTAPPNDLFPHLAPPLAVDSLRVEIEAIGTLGHD